MFTSMWHKRFGILLLVITIFMGYIDAGALRNVATESKLPLEDAELKIMVTTTTATKIEADMTTDSLEATTLKITLPAEESTHVALSRDEDASIKIVEGHTEPISDNVEHAIQSAVMEFDSGEATTLLDPAPGSFDELTTAYVEELMDDKFEKKSQPERQKSSKLLLLSTSKMQDKPKEQEENIEEPEFFAAENNTELEPMESTTTSTEQPEESRQTEMKPAVTKLKPVCEPAAHSSEESTAGETTVKHKEEPIWKKSQTCQHSKETTIENNLATANSKTSTSQGPTNSTEDTDKIASTLEQTADEHNDNAAGSVLIEAEAEYVLLDAVDTGEELPQYGSFTHDDSALHLQPIVQSVEIVPTSIDGELIVSYVHNW